MTIHLPKVNEFGGGNGGGGGSSSFPIIVKNSGSSLPVDLSGYSVGDTFLNTSDKKLYTVKSENSYELNTGVTNSADLDTQTGVVSGFRISEEKSIYKKFSSSLWDGNKEYYVTFDTNSFLEEQTIVYFSQNTPSYYYESIQISIGQDKKIYYRYANGLQANIYDNVYSLLLDYELQIASKYTLILQKNAGTLTAKLVNTETTTELSSNSIETVSSFTYTGTNRLYYGFGGASGSFGSYRYKLSGNIYLLESSEDFLKTISTLSWDSGTDITDKTEYADKTNGILYLYSDDELIAIGGSSE